MNSENMKKMKKEYIEPTMRVVELKHKHHLLQSSARNIYNLSDKPFGTYDDDDDTIGDGEEEEII
jgi:hypothetical protein